MEEVGCAAPAEGMGRTGEFLTQAGSGSSAKMRMTGGVLGSGCCIHALFGLDLPHNCQVSEEVKGQHLQKVGRGLLVGADRGVQPQAGIGGAGGANRQAGQERHLVAGDRSPQRVPPVPHLAPVAPLQTLRPYATALSSRWGSCLLMKLCIESAVSIVWHPAACCSMRACFKCLSKDTCRGWG